MRARKRVVTAVNRPVSWPSGGRHARSGSGQGAAQLPTTPSSTRRAASRPAATPPTPPPAPLEVDLTTDLGRGLLLRNPILAASGSMGYGVELEGSIEVERLGALVTRGTTLRSRNGNLPPRMTETPGGLLNGIGLHNPGLEAVLARYAEPWARWPLPVIINLAADSVADFADLARRLEGVPGIAGIELNLSCPNAARGGTLFALEADAAAAVTAAVRRASDLPLLVKLSPAAPDPRVIARAVADAGADAISAVNTLPGLALAPDRSRGFLGSIYGGLSGPAIRPVALRVVHEITRSVRIPVVAMGGVTSLDDVLDFLAVGAAAVGIGTAALGDPELPGRLADELADECARRGIASHRPLVGIALPRRPASPAARGAEYRP